ncbi:MAG: right-handed parallel beta-helix repeat-containing protein, partial [Thermoplasmata archaeon]|nr:right-handed parallel beta-helix repeat-containing protein [Thermoplasmata archaeon]
MVRELIIIDGNTYIEENLTLDGDYVLVKSNASNPITIQINSSYTLTVLNTTIYAPEGNFRIICYGRIIMKNSTVSNFGYPHHGGGILFYSSNNNVLENSAFLNFTSSVKFSSSMNNIIKNCLFLNYTGTEWFYPSSSLLEAVLHIEETQNTTIDGNRIEDVRGGDGGTQRGGNGVHPPPTHAIYLNNVYNATLANNRIDGVRGGDGGDAGTTGDPAQGGLSTGIALFYTQNVVLRNNEIYHIRGGDGGFGGLSSSSKPPGGGGAYGIFGVFNNNTTLLHNSVFYVKGGNGSVSRMTAGRGGDASGMCFTNSNTNITIWDSLIMSIVGGDAGSPAKGGSSGGGGTGINLVLAEHVILSRNDISGVTAGKSANRAVGSSSYGIVVVGCELVDIIANHLSFITGGNGGVNPIG